MLGRLISQLPSKALSCTSLNKSLLLQTDSHFLPKCPKVFTEVNLPKSFIAWVMGVGKRGEGVGIISFCKFSKSSGKKKKKIQESVSHVHVQLLIYQLALLL